MPRTPEKTERNYEIAKRRLAGEKLEALATEFKLSKSRVRNLVNDYIRKHKKRPPLGSEG